MSRKIKAILIDVAAERVREIEVEPTEEAIMAAIGSKTVRHDWYDWDTHLWWSEEAMFVVPQPHKFSARPLPGPVYAGNALLAGYAGGRPVSTEMTLSEVEKTIQWQGDWYINPDSPADC